MNYYLYKVKFSCQTLTFCDGKAGPGSGWVRIGLARWNRIRIEVKCWIRIRIGFATLIYTVSGSIKGYGYDSTFKFLIQKRGENLDNRSYKKSEYFSIIVYIFSSSDFLISSSTNP
jgi:hypothetical protein